MTRASLMNLAAPVGITLAVLAWQAVGCQPPGRQPAPSNQQIAMEKQDRDSLQHDLSARERTEIHHRQMQISDEELVRLSTQDLVAKVADTPFSLYLFLDRAPDGGLEHFSASYNGVSALLHRPDAAKCLLDEYERIIPQIRDRPSGTDIATMRANGAFAIRFAVLETVLSSASIQTQLGSQGRRRAIAAVITSLDERLVNDKAQVQPLYGESTLEWSALVLAKCLEGQSHTDYVAWYDKQQMEGALVTRPFTYEEAQQVVSFARQYLAK